MKFAVFLAALLGVVGLSTACRCRRIDDECHLGYLMLVKIISLNVDGGKRSYSFTLERDLSQPAAYKPNTFNSIQTGGNYGSCQLDLEVGKTYLLGGQVDLKENTLWATTCGTYWKEWEFVPGTVKSEDQITKVINKCRFSPESIKDGKSA